MEPNSVSLQEGTNSGQWGGANSRTNWGCFI